MALIKIEPYIIDTTGDFTFNNVTATGNLSSLNANLGNTATANFFIGSGNNLSNIAGSNVAGQVGNALLSGTVYTNAQPNITSVGTLSNLTSNGTINLTGASNVSLGAVGNVKITGGTNAYVLSTDGAGNLSWVAQSGGGSISNISNGNSNVNIPTANGNINLTAVGNTVMVITGTGANIAGTLNVTGNATIGNLITSGSGGNITNVNVVIANTFVGSLANGNSNVNIPSANGNINLTAVGNTTLVITGTGANINGTANVTGNLIGGGELNVTGNGLFGGNLTVNGTLTYINSTTLSISDPIINLQTGPNGAAPVANTGKDVGTALNYYDTSAKIAWMGWDVSNAEIAFGSNVGIASEVVTFTSLANIRSGNASLGNAVTSNFFIGAGNNLSNISGSNVTGQVGNALISGTVYTNAQPNITSVGSLTGLTVSNATGVVDFTTTANVTLGAVANLHISGGTNAYVLSTDGSGNLSWVAQSGGGSTSNISNGNSNVNIPSANGNINFTAVGNTVMVITGTGANISGTANVTGNLSVGNITAGSGTGGNITGGNVISTNTFIALTSANFVAASNVNLGAVGNIKITSGSNGQFLQTDGTGNLSWSTVVSGASSNISNGNSNVNIPAANGNINFSAVGNANVVVITGTGANISGTANVTGNLIAGNIIAGTGSGGNITNANVINANTFIALTSANFTSASNVNLGAVGNIKITGGTSNQYLQTDGTGNLSWSTVVSGSTSNISNGNSNVNIPSANGNVNITAVGNTTMIVTGTGANISGTANVTGNLVAGNITAGAGSGGSITGGNLVSANYFTGTLTTNAQPNITSVGSLSGLTVSNATGIVNFTTTANVTLGTVGNLHISGGTNAYVLSTDGSGNLSWVAQSGGGGGANISNGNSNVNIPLANGNINFSAVGNANVLVVTGTGVNVAGTLNTTGNVTLSGANVSLGAVGNVKITGGSNTYVLSTDGTGNLNWAAPPTSANVTVDNFTGNGVQTVFTLSTTPIGINQTSVNYNGATVLRTDYTLANANITFSSAPANGSYIEVTTINLTTSGGGGGTSSAAAVGYSLIFGG